MRCVVGKPFNQRVYSGSGSAQAGPQGIPVLRQQLHLLGEQCIGALQFVLSQQQALDTAGDFSDFKANVLLNAREC